MATAQANNTELNLGLFAQFKHNLQEAFAPYDSPGDALEKMKTLQMKKDDLIDKHIAKFRMMVSKSKLDKSSPILKGKIAFQRPKSENKGPKTLVMHV